MHRGILVVGDDPIGQLINQWPGHEWERGETTAALVGFPETCSDCPDATDWYGIGGRYAGQLVPLPGATSGRVFGDSMPSSEARIMAAGSGTMIRPRRSITHTSGVDQIRRCDLNLTATLAHFTPLELVIDGCHCGGPQRDFSPAEVAACVANSMGLSSHRDPAKHAAILARANKKTTVWKSRLQKLLVAVPDDALVTVVDAHE